MALAFVQVFNISCTPSSENYGELIVKAKTQGTYYIVPARHRSIISAISKKEVSFNKIILLPPGKYIILSNCSYRAVEIKPKHRNTFLTNYVLIDTYDRFEPEDKLPVNCSIKEFGNYTVNLRPNTAIHLFEGEYSFNFLLKQISFELSLQSPVKRIFTNYITFTSSQPSRDKFFVYLPKNHKQTIHQFIGHKLYLLPDTYIVELNSSTKQVLLTNNKPLKLKNGKLFIQYPTRFLKSNYIFPFINKKHILNYNDYYPLIPGLYNISLGLGEIKKKIYILPGKSKYIQTSILQINQTNLCKTNLEYLCSEPNTYTAYDLINKIELEQTEVNNHLVLYPNDYGISMSDAKGTVYKINLKSMEVISLTTGILKVLYPNYSKKELGRIEGIAESKMTGKSAEHFLQATNYYELLPGEYIFRHLLKPNDNDLVSPTHKFTIRSNQLTTIKVNNRRTLSAHTIK